MLFIFFITILRSAMQMKSKWHANTVVCIIDVTGFISLYFVCFISRYPGYKIQHGRLPPSKDRQTIYPHVRRRHLSGFSVAHSFLDIVQMTKFMEQVELEEMTKVQSHNVINPDGQTWWKSTIKGCPGEEEVLASEGERLLKGNHPFSVLGNFWVDDPDSFAFT